MKVALVHDWLNTKFGGAEKVLTELAGMYPEAPIYTLLYNQQDNPAIAADRVRTSSLQRWPAWLQRRSRYLLPLIPQAIEQFDFSEYDVVISSSTAFAKGIITKPETLHICYCHTPMRFVWDYWPAYVAEQQVGPVRRAAIHRLTSRLRLWDYYSAARVDRWVANSETTATRIRKYYHQEPDTVIYPGADLGQFSPARSHGDYFVTLCVLAPYKKIDLAIAACNQTGQQLVVIGDGADRARLEALAGPTIRFAGRVSDAERRQLLADAQALIFPNEEDFGIVPVEAMASGTPVIAYGRGGLTETVVPDVTGLFFDEQTPAALAAVLQDFRRERFSTTDLTQRAADFSTEVFRKRFRAYVEKAYREHRT
jgi:glycosyltransferase involved in cell wall biosynthesis